MGIPPEMWCELSKKLMLSRDNFSTLSEYWGMKNLDGLDSREFGFSLLGAAHLLQSP